MHRMRALAAASLAIGLFSASSAQAQRQAVPGFDVLVYEGQILTFPLNALPGDEFYWVDIFDETDEALAFRETFLNTLRVEGRKTNHDGRLVFNFESESAFLDLSPRWGVDTAQGGASHEREGNRDIGVSELRDTIREGDPNRRGRTSLGQQLNAKAELRDKQSGRVIWLATLSCTPLTGDRDVLMEFVSKVIVDSMSRDGGKTTF